MHYNLEDIAKRYANDGYVVVKDFLSQDEVKVLKGDIDNRLDTYLAKKNIKNEPITYFDGKNNTVDNDIYNFYLNSFYKFKYFHDGSIMDVEDTTKLTTAERRNTYAFAGYGLHVLSKPFNRIVTSEKIKNIFAALGHIDPVIFTCSIIFKNAKIGKAIDAHRDTDFFWTQSKETIIGVWIPLEDATLENGCLEFWPGSHKLSAEELKIQSENSDDKYVPAEIKAGTLIIIEGDCVHRSKANLSNKSRWAFTFHAYDGAKTHLADDHFLDKDKILFLHMNSKVVE